MERILQIISFRKPYQIINFIIYKITNRWKLVKVPYKPPHITFFPSYNCTLSCKMCLTHSPIIADNPYKYKGAPFLTYEMFKDAITRFRTTWSVAFIGNGEPLLNRDIFKMMDFAFYKMRMPVSLVTNGTLIHIYLKDILNSPLYEISISVNAYTPEEYHRITGMPEEVFHRIVSNVSELVKQRNKARKRMKILISLIIDKENYKKIPEMIKFAEELGVDQIGLYNIMPWFVNGLLPEERSLYAEPEIIEFINSIPPSNYVDVLLPALLEKKENRLCRDAYHSMSIDGNGDIGGCERMMLNTSLNGKYYEPGVFNNHHFVYLRRLFNSSHLTLPEPCKICYNNSHYPMRLLRKNGC